MDKTPAARLTATYRGPDGKPVERDEYAGLLIKRMEQHVGQRPVLVGASAVFIAAELLEELAGAYPAEPLGRMARSTAAGLRDFLELPMSRTHAVDLHIRLSATPTEN